MATTTQTRRTRTNSLARWQKAVQRAISEGIQIRQLQGTGQWVATSGTDAAVANEVQVVGNVAHGCDCLAGLNDDPVCKHRAAFYPGLFTKGDFADQCSALGEAFSA
jgi:hypothetical protein